jgi:hypothetical protein
VESELGTVPTFDAVGHDGQLYYMIARDPLGRAGTIEAITSFDPNGPRYRYRRILFPLVAGGWGWFSGQATLFCMIASLVLSHGLAAVAIADICGRLRLFGVTVLLALLNAGALISLLLLTADVMALAFAATGITLLLRSRTGLSTVAFALAALTKEVYILVPLAAAGWLWHQHQRRRGIRMAMLAAAPLSAWSLAVTAFVPAAQSTVNNLGVPFVGLYGAFSVWTRFERNPVELAVLLVTVGTFVAAGWALFRSSAAVLQWQLAAWLALASLASVDVWGKPNNMSRAFAFVWPLTIFLLRSTARTRELDGTVAGERMEPQSRMDKACTAAMGN